MSSQVVILDHQFNWLAFHEASASATTGALDIETTVEENPWRNPPQLVSVAMTFDGGTAWVAHGRDIERIRDVIERIPWIMQNGLFDRLMLKAIWGVNAPLKHDTMAMQYLLDPDAEKGLEALSERYLELPAYKGVDYKNILDEPWEKVAEMNGEDACRTFNLFRPLADHLNEDKALSRVYQWLILPALNTLIELTQNGVPVDQGRLDELTLEFEDELERLLGELQEATPDPDPDTYGKHYWSQPSKWRVRDVVDEETGEILIKGRGRYLEQHPNGLFNPGSPAHVKHIIFDQWDLPVLELTDTGAPSADKDTLLLLETYHANEQQAEWIAKLRNYRRAAKALSATLHAWPKLWDNEGWLHPRFKPLHVVTGRLSSEGPNIQQVPRDKRFRRCLGGVDGYSWMKADYSQIELRIAAWIAQEPTMLEAYETGQDLHALTCRRVLGIEDHLTEIFAGVTGRDVGKLLNFGLLYGMGPKTLMRIAREANIFLTHEQAEQYHHSHFMSYPDLSLWHDQMRAKLERDGWVRSPLGRVRYFKWAKLPWKVAREQDLVGHKIADILQGTNHPVQSFAHDLTLMALNRVHQQLKGSPVQLMLEVHDEMDLLVPDNMIQETAELVKATMEDITWLERFGIDLTVPVLAEVEVGSHWGDVKEMTV